MTHIFKESMMHTACDNSDLIVFSHLRWDFVFQRPQHLLMRFAQHRRVFYFEEPIFGLTSTPKLHMNMSAEGVHVVVPHVPSHLSPEEVEVTLARLVDEMIENEQIENYAAWYYTPMALSFTRHLEPVTVIFDAMDELSLFKGAPRSLLEMEQELMDKAHVVFTGGESLYQAKKHRHHNIHAFPSSIDYAHFAKGRRHTSDPYDQANIAHPRVGFYGVVDERFNIDLLAEMADLKPDYQFVIIGPVVKIDPETLPQRPNIHYLGKKEYSELPVYLAGWDCAMMPFALNDSTRFISPTKTPEFLAAGKPVVSTSINDVVHPYGDEKLVYIADDAKNFVESIDKAMAEKANDPDWVIRVDHFLKGNSWDMTFLKMAKLELALEHAKPVSGTFKFPIPVGPEAVNFVTGGAV